MCPNILSLKRLEFLSFLTFSFIKIIKDTKKVLINIKKIFGNEVYTLNSERNYK